MKQTKKLPCLDQFPLISTKGSDHEVESETWHAECEEEPGQSTENLQQVELPENLLPLVARAWSCVEGEVKRECKVLHRKVNNKAILFRSCYVERTGDSKSSIVAVVNPQRNLLAEHVITGDNNIAIAEIQQFVCHRHSDFEKCFAVLHVFVNLNEDKSSGLHFVDFGSYTLGIAHLDSLSPPLLTAVEEPFMWILNLNNIIQ